MTPARKRLLQAGFSLVIVVFIFSFVFARFGDAADVWSAITTLSSGDVVLLVVATVWNLFTYWMLIVSVTPGLRYPQAAVLNQSSTAVANTVPAGGAIALGLTYAMLGSWGFSKSRVSVSVVVGGIWNNFVKLGSPIVALAIIAVQGKAGAEELALAIVGVAILVAAITVFALILRSDELASRIGALGARGTSRVLAVFRRGPVEGWDSALVTFRHQIIGLIRHRWLAITAAAVISHASLYLVLLTSLRTMGVSDSDIGWAQVLLVYTVARLATAIGLTPGGVGVIELILVGGLTAIGGDDVAVVAAVLVYRFLTYALPIALGGLTYLYWRHNKSWLDTAPPLPAELAARD